MRFMDNVIKSQHDRGWVWLSSKMRDLVRREGDEHIFEEEYHAFRHTCTTDGMRGSAIPNNEEKYLHSLQSYWNYMVALLHLTAICSDNEMQLITSNVQHVQLLAWFFPCLLDSCTYTWWVFLQFPCILGTRPGDRLPSLAGAAS